MEKSQHADGRPKSLILPPRQLKAALRKSADRAQRLADAFGQTVPTVTTGSRKTATRAATKR